MILTRCKRLGLPGLLLLGAAGGLPMAATPLSRTDLPWWRARFAEKQAELRQVNPELIFLGDSITQDWERSDANPAMNFRPVWDRFYGGRRAVDLGFTGDTTAHLLWRMRNGELDGINPRAAVVLIGANNFGRLHWSAADTLTGIDAILAELHRRLPQTKVLLLSVLPSDRGAWVIQQGMEVNRALAARDWHGTNVTYLDVTPIFMRGGEIDRAAFMDPLMSPPRPALHPNAQAQARMAEMMEPILSSMLGDRNRVQR